MELRRGCDAIRAQDDCLALDGRYGVFPDIVAAADCKTSDRVRAFLHPTTQRNRRSRLHPAGREPLRRAGLEEDTNGPVGLPHRAGVDRTIRLKRRLTVDVPPRKKREAPPDEVLVYRMEVIYTHAGHAVHGGDKAVRARVGDVPEPLRLADADVVVADIVLGWIRILIQTDRPRGSAIAGRGDLHSVERQVAVLAPAVAAILHEDIHKLLVFLSLSLGVRAALVPEDGAKLRSEDRRHHVVPKPAVRRPCVAIRRNAVRNQYRRGYPLADGRAAGRSVDDADRDILPLLRVRSADIVGEVERDAADEVAVIPRCRRPVVSFAIVFDRVVDGLDWR